LVYELIRLLSEEFSIRQLCQVLGASKSAYYAYVSGKSYENSSNKQANLDAVKRVFEQHKKRYGSRRITEQLRDEGYGIGRYQVSSLMAAQDLVAKQPKRFVPKTTQSHPNLRRNENLLLIPTNLPQAPNEVWVSDITYLPSIEYELESWLYLCVWMDLFSRKIIGWCVEEHMRESLVIRALQQAVRNRQPEKVLIIHSDGGGQYASNNFRALLRRNQFWQSMTRVDNHYDNAHIESFFSRFKTELEDEFPFFGLKDANLKIFDFIEAYYNTIRKHSTLGYKSPNQFEERYWMDFWKGKL